MKITKTQLKQIIMEELSGVMEGAYDFDFSKAAEVSGRLYSRGRTTADTEEDMAAYLIKNGDYKANRGGTVNVFTGTTGGARSSLKNSGKFTDDDIRTYINKLDKQIR